MPLRAIMFDCWDTLFTSDLGADLRAIARQLNVPCDRAFIKQFEHTFMLQPHSDLTRPAQSLGADAKAARLIVERLQTSLERQRAFPDTLATLSALRQAGYRLGILTNSFSLGFEHLAHRFNLQERVDLIVPSYQVALIKPDTAIFRLAQKQLGVTSNEIIMVGDSPLDDIEPALALGWHAVLLDRQGHSHAQAGRIRSLTEFISYLAPTHSPPAHL